LAKELDTTVLAASLVGQVVQTVQTVQTIQKAALIGRSLQSPELRPVALHACSGVEASEKETVKATVETFDGVFAWKAIRERSKLRLSYEDAASFVGVGRQARNTTGSSAFSYISHQRH